jgi:hypothetical protein
MVEKIRHQLFLPKPVSDRLEALAAKPGASEVRDPCRRRDRLAQPPRRSELEDRFAMRLDRMSAALGRIERDGHVQLETLALFVRYELAIQAPLAENDHAGRALAASASRPSSRRSAAQIAAGRRTLDSNAEEEQ